MGALEECLGALLSPDEFTDPIDAQAARAVLSLALIKWIKWKG